GSVDLIDGPVPGGEVAARRENWRQLVALLLRCRHGRGGAAPGSLVETSVKFTNVVVEIPNP
ncbi:MAG: hypothetical protein ACHQNA_14495, partial [Acidimicrobiales bacterium]